MQTCLFSATAMKRFSVSLRPGSAYRGSSLYSETRLNTAHGIGRLKPSLSLPPRTRDFTETAGRLFLFRSKSHVFNNLRKLVLFDVDGTLVVPKSGKEFRRMRLADWQFIHRRAEAVKGLILSGPNVALVTNQGGAAFGYFKPYDMAHEIARTANALATQDTYIPQMTRLLYQFHSPWRQRGKSDKRRGQPAFATPSQPAQAWPWHDFRRPCAPLCVNRPASWTLNGSATAPKTKCAASARWLPIYVG